MDLKTIREALAAQIKAYVADDTTVYAYPISQPTMPCISIYPGAAEYVSYFTTLGPSGTAEVFFRLKVDVNSDAESMGIEIDRYLGIGTGNTASIVDAVHSDRTIAGTVISVAALSCVAGDPDAEPGTAYIDVQILVSKQNAQV